MFAWLGRTVLCLKQKTKKFRKLPVLCRSEVSDQHFPYPRFGIEEYPVADSRVGDLPGIAQSLERPGRDMQVVAYVASGQVAFLPDRRDVVLRRLA